MSFWHLVLLALVQGITEFLPISSSAHLVLLPRILHWSDQGVLIDVAAHVGTLAAVIGYFRREVGQMILAAAGICGARAARGRLVETGEWERSRRLVWALVLATLPVVVIGYLFMKTGLVDALRRVDVIAATSIGFGILLWAADRWAPAARDLDRLSLRHALLIGLAQALALVPGTSRSGITMTAARALGFTRPDAARFSMLLAIPTILAAGTLGVLTLLEEGPDAPWEDALLVAGLSALVAYLAIAALMRWLARHDFGPFVIYRVLLGVLLWWWMS
ncbi:MAG: undecaprenyl-diphosphate phosphatase [Alphaproteobacteria bacterium]|nr:MAG: undecaprenyl-diphosphate phosphatase [Alphaproteobacteria bacterium]